jgi:hypothetical protein
MQPSRDSDVAHRPLCPRHGANQPALATSTVVSLYIRMRLECYFPDAIAGFVFPSGSWKYSPSFFPAGW